MRVRLATSRDVLHITLDSPQKKNALSRAMLDDIRVALADLDPQVQGVVLTGAAHIFSAGADLDEMHGDERDLTYDDEVGEVTRLIRTVEVPVIAAVEGPCIGAAVDIALACDGRIAGADSYLQVPAARLGILYSPAAVRRWADEFGTAVVKEILLLGRRMPAEVAYARGLVTGLVATGTAVAAAESLLADGSDASRDALAATKSLLNGYLAGDTDLEALQERRRRLLASPHRRQTLARRHASRNGR